MRIYPVSSNSFTSKCLIQGRVTELKTISAKMHQNKADSIMLVMFHPSAIIYPDQTYADVIIANGKDTKIVNDFLHNNNAWAAKFGEFGTSKRAKNIIIYLWPEDKVNKYNASDVIEAINNNQFNYNTLDINT